MSRPRHAARALVGPARRTAPSRKQRAAHSRWSGARPPDPSAPGARRRPKYPLARAPPGRREAPVASDATSGRATPAPRAIRGRGPGYISGTPHCTPLPPLIRPPKLRPARRAGGPRQGIGPPRARPSPTLDRGAAGHRARPVRTSAPKQRVYRPHHTPGRLRGRARGHWCRGWVTPAARGCDKPLTIGRARDPGGSAQASRAAALPEARRASRPGNISGTPEMPR